MKVLLIDNYDSFTYNLYQYMGEVFEAQNSAFVLDVIRNDEKSYDDIVNNHYERIVISPGPGHPSDKAYFGVCEDVLRGLSKTIPTLGVCLGMQGIAHVFGGRVVQAKVPMHGKTSAIIHDGKGVFAGLPQKIEVMRYHSLVVEPSSLPPELEITARADNDADEIMGLRHKIHPIEGIQFHPESFGSEGGKRMLANFLLGAQN